MTKAQLAQVVRDAAAAFAVDHAYAEEIARMANRQKARAAAKIQKKN